MPPLFRPTNDGRVYFVYQKRQDRPLGRRHAPGLARAAPFCSSPAGAEAGRLRRRVFLTKINGRLPSPVRPSSTKGEKEPTYDCMAATADSIYGPL